VLASCCSADGLAIHEICVGRSIDHQVVRRWLRRYLADGFDGLKDRHRTGRPTQIESHVWQKLATLVAQAPEKFMSLWLAGRCGLERAHQRDQPIHKALEYSSRSSVRVDLHGEGAGRVGQAPPKIAIETRH